MISRDSKKWSPDESDEQVLSKIGDLELLSPIPSPCAQARGFTFISPLSSPDLPRKRNTTSLSERDLQNSETAEQVRKFSKHQNLSDDFSERLLPSERMGSQSSMSTVLLSPSILPGSLPGVFISPRRQTLRPLSGRSNTEGSLEEDDTIFSPDTLSGRSSGTLTNDLEFESSSDLYTEETKIPVVPEKTLIGKSFSFNFYQISFLRKHSRNTIVMKFEENFESKTFCFFLAKFNTKLTFLSTTYFRHSYLERRCSLMYSRLKNNLT